MRKKTAKPKKKTGMVVRRETRADMAHAWVREIAQAEIQNMLNGRIVPAIASIESKLERLRVDIDSVERRAGSFTGMTETETSDLVETLVKARVSFDTVRNIVDKVLQAFYGPRPIEHPSFRSRLGTSQDHSEWWNGGRK